MLDLVIAPPKHFVLTCFFQKSKLVFNRYIKIFQIYYFLHMSKNLIKELARHAMAYINAPLSLSLELRSSGRQMLVIPSRLMA